MRYLLAGSWVGVACLTGCLALLARSDLMRVALALLTAYAVVAVARALLLHRHH